MPIEFVPKQIRGDINMFSAFQQTLINAKYKVSILQKTNYYIMLINLFPWG